MPITKPKGVPFEWLEEHVLPMLGDAPRQDLAAKLDELKQVPSSLPAATLDLKDALNIFQLRFNQVFDAWSLADNELCEIPSLLAPIKDEYLFVTEGLLANEALARSQINDILIICIGEEKRLALREYNRPDVARPTQSFARPTTPPSNPAPLLLQFETKLHRLVTYEKEKRVLQGVADYSLWYDKDEPLGTNLILVEAKREGIVHRTRESEGKQNKLVYGLSTDGNEFQFWRLDNASELTRSRKLDWKGGDGSRIVSYLRLVIRSAILSSPSTTPIKDKERRDVSLSTFRDPEKIKSFDYGGRRFDLPRLGDDDDNDDDSMDIVDLSLLNSNLQ